MTLFRTLLIATFLVAFNPAPYAHAAGSPSAIAERYLGTNPTKMRRLWCANFVGMIERKAGRRGSGSNLAKSYLRAPGYHRVPLKAVRRDDIVVTGRRGGGHVGYFRKWVGGKLQLISGNSRGGKVAIGLYAPSRVLGVRRPATSLAQEDHSTHGKNTEADSAARSTPRG